MKKYIVSFATPEYFDSQKLLNDSALRNGVEEFISYNKKWLTKTKFYKDNKTILKQFRGSGFWLWKPFIILEALSRIEKGEILIYSDSGIEIISDLAPIFEICDKKDGLIFFNNLGAKCKDWTKRDCFIKMDADSDTFYFTEQVMVGFAIFKKNEKNIKFVEDWLKFGVIDNLITDSDNICGKENIEGFIEHRHDQSILSILVKKWELEVFRYPVLDVSNNLEYSKKYTNSIYPDFLNHHRKRKYNFKDFIRLKIIKIKKIFKYGFKNFKNSKK